MLLYDENKELMASPIMHNGIQLTRSAGNGSIEQSQTPNAESSGINEYHELPSPSQTYAQWSFGSLLAG
jgi:hypothetical protein